MMEDLKKNKEIYNTITGQCAAGNVLRAARSLTRLYDEALRPVGLTITQFGLMNAIGRFEPASISDLAVIMSNDRTTLSRNLKPLEKAGLVFRGGEGEGRRRRLLLTTLGQERLNAALPLWQAAQERVAAVLDEEARRHLFSGLRLLASDRLGS
ncbi:MAG: MarR family transcriptional regulator [Hyphomonas sp.]|nr:MarR family transcriptional regulator [Hyphomonas sp.]